MKFQDIFQEVIQAIVSNKVRSGLTILGIVIGIGSVIAMISVGQGAQNSIQESIQSIGSNLIMVSPGFNRNAGPVSAGRGGAQTLTLDDADTIASEVQNIGAVAPDTSRRYQAVVGSNNTNTSIVGTTPAYATIRNVEIGEGKFFTDSEVLSNAKVAVLGNTTMQDLFGTDADPAEVVGETVKINKIEFKIVGVTKAKTTSGGFGSQDDRILIPISTFQKILSNDKYISTISISALDSGESMTQAQSDIKALLLERHKIKDETQADFNIMNQADIISTASSVTSIFTALLSSIAAISLIVGGIGIMNMMLTNVTERTKEIGLRKAIGAQEGDISKQFLLESIVLTVIGGAVGVLLGIVIAYLITTFASIATSVSTGAVLLSLGVASVIGIVFGYYPAKKAAKMNPIDALRYE
jgi:putative ABC transport system permease protein